MSSSQEKTIERFEKIGLKRGDINTIRLDRDEFMNYVHAALYEVVLQIPDIDRIRKSLYSEFGQLMEKKKVLKSLQSFSWLIKRLVAVRDYSDWEEYSIPFYNILRTKLALAFHPEYIEALALYLRKNKFQKWSAIILENPETSFLRSWFRTNVLGRDGDVDWKLIDEKVRQYCDCEFEVRKQKIHNAEHAIKMARECIDQVLEDKENWQPAGDLSASNKSLYCHIIKLAQYRRKASRPDINYSAESRPNWYKIAEDMGEKYFKTLYIAGGKELEYRDEDEAIFDLNILIKGFGYPEWNPQLVFNKNRSLYNWFANHKNDQPGIDWESIVNLCEEKVRNRFVVRESI